MSTPNAEQTVALSEATLDGLPSTPADLLQLTRVDHYVVLHELGRGGMGTVYAAYDETLDRKVAIKLLHAGQRYRARLVREAQAMAKLSHPNVVQVYEIGEREDAAYIAMEFVNGRTLSRWLDDSRSREAILDTFQAAGRGLAAAHDKGLVHRDFKPDNVMISADGDAKVMDFGLAHGRGRDDGRPGDGPGEREPGDGPLATELTMAGAVLGTPAYMAPEQFLGEDTDAKSDQFSFCVALWEALYGQRPFRGESMAALALSVTSGDRREPERDDLPGWMRQVIERGLAIEPAARWPSMHALLEALRDDPTRRRRPWWVGGGALLAAGAVVAALTWARHREHAEAVAACELEARAIEAEWNDDVRGRLADAFAATEVEIAGDQWDRAAEGMSSYVADWTARRRQVCVAADVEQTLDTGHAADVRACLDERRASVGALVDLWSEGGDPQIVLLSVAAVHKLPRLSWCEDRKWLAHRMAVPDDPGQRERVLELRAELEQVSARTSAGRYPEAEALARSVHERALDLGWTPLVAETLFTLGILEHRQGRFADARDSLKQAYFEGGRSGHDLVALRSAAVLGFVVGYRLANLEGGVLWTDVATMLVERLGLEDTTYQASVFNSRGVLNRIAGDLDTALADYRLVLTSWEAALGPTHPDVAQALMNLANIHHELGQFDEALAAHERAREILETVLGPEHPKVGTVLNNLGAVQVEVERYDEALASFQRAVEIREVLDPDDPFLANCLHNIGLVYSARRQFEDALGPAQRAVEIREEALGAEHPATANGLTSVGIIQLGLGNLDEADAALTRALEIGIEGELPGDEVGETRFALARLWLERGERARALEGARQALEDYRGTEGDHSRLTAEIEAWLAAESDPEPEG